MILRQPLRTFADQMERVLRDNDHKDGWEDMGRQEISDCIDQELLELHEAIISGDIECIRHE